MLIHTREKRTAWLDESPGGSNVREVENGWTSIWRVKVPSKLKVFLWRLARQSLPTGDVLHHRNMAPQSNCAICGEEDSWRHSLVECHHARSVWALASEEISDFVYNLQEPHSKAWIAAMIKSLSQTEVTQVVVTMWALWHARRKIIHEGLFQSPLSTHCFIRRFIVDLEVLAHAPSSTSERGPMAPRWIPPPSGVAKVNVDAVVSKNFSIAVIAAVARSTAGEFLGASSMVLKGLSDPETLDALACREGLSVAADILLQRVRVTTDCQNMIRSIEGAGRGSYGHLVQELNARRNDLQMVQFVHEGRSSNGAHCLARSSLYLDIGRHVWFNSPPKGVGNHVNIVE
jgi:ribonuclease HI